MSAPPSPQSQYILFATISGGIYFQEFNVLEGYQWAGFVCGIMIMFGGLYCARHQQRRMPAREPTLTRPAFLACEYCASDCAVRCCSRLPRFTSAFTRAVMAPDTSTSGMETDLAMDTVTLEMRKDGDMKPPPPPLDVIRQPTVNAVAIGDEDFDEYITRAPTPYEPHWRRRRRCAAAM